MNLAVFIHPIAIHFYLWYNNIIKIWRYFYELQNISRY